MASVTIGNLRKAYGAVAAVHGVSLDITPAAGRMHLFDAESGRSLNA